MKGPGEVVAGALAPPDNLEGSPGRAGCNVRCQLSHWRVESTETPRTFVG